MNKNNIIVDINVNASCITGEISSPESITTNVSIPTVVMEKDYDKLINTPSINNIPLSGNQTAIDLKLQQQGSYLEDNDFLSNEEIYNILSK